MSPRAPYGRFYTVWERSRFRHYSNLRFDSFCHLGRIWVFSITASLDSLLLPLGRVIQRESTATSIRYFIYFRDTGGEHGLFTSAKAGVSRSFFFLSNLFSEEREDIFS